MLKPGNHPVMKVEATFRRKDDSEAGRQTLFGKVRKEGLELWAVWEDKPSKEYPFPHPELDYYAVQVIDDSPPESSSASSSNPSTSSSNPTQVALQSTSGRPPGPLHDEAFSNRNDLAGGRSIGVPLVSTSKNPSDGAPLLVDPNALNPYEPLTFGPWINAVDDDGFRTRDLIRELRDAPEFELRINQICYVMLCIR